MKNYIEEGDTVTLAAPSGGVVSGTFYVIGALLGVATTTVATGLNFALKVGGVFEYTKTSAQAWAVGDKIYWDTTNLVMTNVAGSLAYVGVATEVAANPSAVGRVKLKTMLS